ncbi:hypothetical protein [Tenacibaculum jejuense]|uniref:Lipoprotein n=1 Tax=Tenacibaculum jejuense TaxID=584609 RepID=A0A238U7C5_9FLAO|nr:hypothetical protein [Tenacibaculum jejuense]SNR15083.1 conserved exported protein of unknown function [Tenacibaculum jejuense]
MKKKILLLGVVFFTLILSAQEATLDKIAKETCEYLNEVDFKSLSKKDLEIKLGIQIIKLYSKYEKELKSEGLEFELNEDQKGIESYAEKVAFSMIKFCPEVLAAFADDGEDEMQEVASILYLEGEIKKISGEELYVIEIKDTSGKTQKFLWLNNFEGSDELIELDKKVKGKKVKIFYEDVEYFSPKLKEYIVRKKVSKVEFL